MTVWHGDTTAGRKLANAAATRTVGAGRRDGAAMGKSARATRRAKIFKELDLAETYKDFQSEGKRIPLPPSK
jgi:hypothetical protein